MQGIDHNNKIDRPPLRRMPAQIIKLSDQDRDALGLPKKAELKPSQLSLKLVEQALQDLDSLFSESPEISAPPESAVKKDSQGVIDPETGRMTNYDKAIKELDHLENDIKNDSILLERISKFQEIAGNLSKSKTRDEDLNFLTSELSDFTHHFTEIHDNGGTSIGENLSKLLDSLVDGACHMSESKKQIKSEVLRKVDEQFKYTSMGIVKTEEDLKKMKDLKNQVLNLITLRFDNNHFNPPKTSTHTLTQQYVKKYQNANYKDFLPSGKANRNQRHQKRGAIRLAHLLKGESARVFSQIKPEDLLKYEKDDQTAAVERFVDHTNKISNMVLHEILSEPSQGNRNTKIQFFIELMDKSDRIGDFNTANAIFSALNKPSISRLIPGKEDPPSGLKGKLKIFENKYTSQGNFKNLRQKIETTSKTESIIPCLPIILRDMTFIHDGNAANSSSRALLNDRQIQQFKPLTQPWKLNPQDTQSYLPKSKCAKSVLEIPFTLNDDAGNHQISKKLKPPTS